MAVKPVVVGVDHSPESHRAVELAARIAEAAGAPLIPVHAVPVVPLVNGAAGIGAMPAFFSPELQDELTRASQAQVVRALQNVLPAAAIRRLEVQTGPAAFVIAEVARTRRAQLIVLGGKAHGALARGLGRSTAHYLVRTLDVPLLVVAGAASTISRVLAAVDLSAASLPTLKAAQRLAELLGAQLRLLHVVEPLPFARLIPATLDDAAYRRRSQEIFDAIVSRMKALREADRVVRSGTPAETISEEAAVWHADLLVVGSHGKGWVDRILLGSTTERLVTELPTSVLVVPIRAMASRRGAKARRAAPARYAES
jgi:nucleotide-binding universal stress UspA family protein